MTKADLRKIFDLTESLVKKEIEYAKRYIEQNPTDEKWRNMLKAERINAHWAEWLAIKEEYKDIWEGEE